MLSTFTQIQKVGNLSLNMMLNWFKDEGVKGKRSCFIAL
jgi:hypothetical protein